MITEQEILDLGFRIFGEYENDPFYKIIFKNRNFNILELSGDFNNKNEFVIYALDKIYTDIEEIKLLFIVCDFQINREMTIKYGSDICTQTQDYSEIDDNEKTINNFIIELCNISNDKRKLPLVIKAPNKELFSPQIKMVMKNDNIFGGVEKMIITY